jgi:hypothetical protein
LKARQKGLSKIIDADQMIDCIRKPTNAVIISHEKEATKRLFASVKGFIDYTNPKPSMSIDSQSAIKFPKPGSNYFIGTAGQKAFGRGDTVNRAHLSEAAFYENLERILGGISEAAEYGQIDIETTPNGRGEFYDLWQKAKQGKSSYTPIFIPWFIDDEYSVDNLTEQERQGLSVSVQKMFSIPDAEFLKQITPDEQKLVKMAKDEWKINITAGQLKWRRYKIWDKGILFFQEYPEDDISCFLQSGRSVFNQITTTKDKRIPLDDLVSWHGTDEQKKELKKRRMYAGLDGAEGTLTGDAHCFAVIDFINGKATVVFELHSNDPIDVFDFKVAQICKQYNILVGVEKNGVGLAHLNKLETLGVPFVIDWDTTAGSRPVMITELEEAYRKGFLTETYTEAEEEARDMVYTEKNRAEHKQGKHDDRVFARAIAWQMRAYQMGVEFVYLPDNKPKDDDD